MNNKRIVSIHLFIWLFTLFCTLPYSMIGQNLTTLEIITHILAFLYLMVVFYLFYLFLAPLFLNKKNFYRFFIIFLVTVLILPFFGYLILFLAKALYEGTFSSYMSGYSLKMHMSAFYPVMTAAVFGSFFRVIFNWFDDMNRKTELEKQKLYIELDLLKSKINPHFLFNTLNNIDSLIRKDTEEASVALIRLSDMMRYLTYETSSDVVKIEKEIEYIRNLIELYRLRIKSPDDIRFETEGDLNAHISPTLFVPLVENAFKFATFRAMKPCIDIRLTSHNGKIVFAVSNYYEEIPANHQKEDSGYGLINLEKRLRLTYPDRHQLEIEKGERQFRVKLTIDTHGD